MNLALVKCRHIVLKKMNIDAQAQETTACLEAHVDIKQIS